MYLQRAFIITFFFLFVCLLHGVCPILLGCRLQHFRAADTDELRRMGALKELCGNIVTVMIVMIRIWRVSKVRLRSAKCADQLSDLMLANHTSESECCRKTRK